VTAARRMSDGANAFDGLEQGLVQGFGE